MGRSIVTRPMNRDRFLEELERDRWPAPSGGETRLMATMRELQRKPVDGLTVDDMRLLLGQDVGLAHLLPLAVEVLRINPLAEGDMYEGDLLALLTRRAEVWTECPELERDVRLIVSELADVPPGMGRPEHDGDAGVMVTNGRISSAGRAFAQKQRLHVVDRALLGTWAAGPRPLWELLQAVPPPRRSVPLN